MADDDFVQGDGDPLWDFDNSENEPKVEQDCGERFEELISDIIGAYEGHYHLEVVYRDEYLEQMEGIIAELYSEKYEGCIYTKKYSEMMKIVDEYPELLEWIDP